MSNDVQGQVDSAYAQYQAAIRSHRDRLRSLRPGRPAYGAAFDAMVGAAEELLVYEQQIPAILAGPDHLRSRRVVNWTIRTQTVLVLVAALSVVPGWTAWPWLLLVAVHAVGIGALQSAVTGAEHYAGRSAAFILNAVSAFDAVIVFHVISGWFTVLALSVTLVLIAVASHAATTPGSRA